MMKGDFHIDMSGKIGKFKTIGIACMCTYAKENVGCVLRSNAIKKINKELFQKNDFFERAKLYGILIYLILKDKPFEINRLIICNDEIFKVVKSTFLKLMDNYIDSENIINISDYRDILGKHIGSPADSLARCYRRRGYSLIKRNGGKKINPIEVRYKNIKELWIRLNLEAGCPTKSYA